MATDKMTIAYRSFKNNHTRLNTCYWVSAYSYSQLGTLIASKATSPDDPILTLLPPLSFTKRTAPYQAKDFPTVTDDVANTMRALLLVMCCANLESFLDDLANSYGLHLGYKDANNSFRLSRPGKALLAPVLDSSTLTKKLNYSCVLYSVDINRYMGDLGKAYKIRNAVAHDCGVVSHRIKNIIGGPPGIDGDPISISEEYLLNTLNTVNRIAEAIDDKVRTEEYIVSEQKLLIINKVKSYPWLAHGDKDIKSKMVTKVLIDEVSIYDIPVDVILEVCGTSEAKEIYNIHDYHLLNISKHKNSNYTSEMISKLGIRHFDINEINEMTQIWPLPVTPVA